MNSRQDAAGSNTAWCTLTATMAAGLATLATAAGCNSNEASNAPMVTPTVEVPAQVAGARATGGSPSQAGMSSQQAGRTAPQVAQAAMSARPAMGGASAPITTPPASTAGTSSTAGSSGSTAVASAGNAAPADPKAGMDTGAAATGCLDTVTDFSKMGPFSFELKVDGSVYMWVPMVPAGCKIPVTHLANGTGAGCMNYEEINSYLASHGFLASCYDNPNTGAGDQGVMALEKVYELYPDLADKKIGSTGHSQGGQASFIVLQKAEAKFGPDFKYAGLAMEPASGFGSQPAEGTWASLYGMIKSPMFMFSGTADVLVSSAWVGSAYSAMGDIEAYWWSAIGATHVPTPDAHTQQVAIPWFRWKLLGDKKACEAFKALPDTDQWDAVQSKNEAPCE